jgi:hypothetical protein
MTSALSKLNPPIQAAKDWERRILHPHHLVFPVVQVGKRECKQLKLARHEKRKGIDYDLLKMRDGPLTFVSIQFFYRSQVC